MADEANEPADLATLNSTETIDSVDETEQRGDEYGNDEFDKTSETMNESGDAMVTVTDTEDGLHVEVTDTDGDHEAKPVNNNTGIDSTLSLQEQLASVKNYIGGEYETLLSTHLKEYEGIKDFKARVADLIRVYKRCEDYVTDLGDSLAHVVSFMNEIRQGIEKKIIDEGLDTWLPERQDDNTPDKQQQAENKLIIAKAAEANAELEQAKLDVATARESVASATEASRKAALAAERAAIEANEAAERAEEARLIAEEKAREEEASRQKAEEKKQKKAEEEAKLKEEEDRKREEYERLKGTPEFLEMQRNEEEKRKQEEARKNPTNWPRFLYNCDEVGDFDGGYKCIIRYFPDTFEASGDIVCTIVDQTDQPVDIGESEELVSHIIEIKPTEENAEFKFEEAMSVAIPHIAPRSNTSREAVIKYLSSSGKWMTMDSKEAIFDDIKEAKFVEVRLKKFGTLAVVQRRKVDRMHVTKKGGKFTSSVDPRIQMNVRPGVFRVNTDFVMQVQPVELAAVSDLKARNPEKCSDLISSSPIVHLGMRNRNFVRPISVTVPIPPNQVKAKRPSTAHPGKSASKSSSASRPMSAASGGFGLGSFENKNEAEAQEDEVWLVKRSEKGEYERDEKIVLSQSKKGDLVTFELTAPVDRFFVVRTREGSKSHQVENIARLLEKSLSIRYTQIILRQKNDDLYDVTVVCSALNKVERNIRKLAEDGYEEGPMPSKDIEMKEGEEIDISFRGNIQCDEEDLKLKFVYNSQLKSSIMMYVSEIDKFAQKSIDCYRGFAQFYIKGMVSVPVWSEEEKARAKKEKPTKFEMVEGDVLACEQLIYLTKPEAEPSKPIQRVPVSFKADGPIDESLLQHLAADLGDEWKQVANKLNIKRTRLQAILRNNVNSQTEDTIYDMLVTWAKRVPRSCDKVAILCEALIQCERGDLAEDVRYKDEDYRAQRANSAKESYLKRAFLQVAQDKDAVSDWKEIAHRLTLSDTEIKDIENQQTNTRNMCYNMLLHWRENNPEVATIPKLTSTLRRLRKNTLAEQIKRQCRA